MPERNGEGGGWRGWGAWGMWVDEREEQVEASGGFKRGVRVQNRVSGSLLYYEGAQPTSLLRSTCTTAATVISGN
eukprot:8256693-Pyramimonas_sp.AAC.1